MYFYTNAYQRGNNILVCGYENGQRFKRKVPYKPYFFVSSNKENCEYISLYKEPLDKISFDSIQEAKKFQEQYEDVANFKIHGLDRFVYTFLNDEFPGEVQYDRSLIKIWTIDIETGKAATGGFASADLANGPINCIGIGYKGKKYEFSLKDYTGKRKDIINKKCFNEHELLREFIAFIQDDEFRPDVITGWNIEQFDIPFIVNRIKRLLGDDFVKKLSPWGIIQEKIIESRGKEIQTFIPIGISILDGMQLFKKFTQNQLESYALDHVAFTVVGKRKLDYSEYDSIDEMYNIDFNKYIDYNAEDIDRTEEIEEKERFLDLALAIAYDAKVNFQDAMTSVLLWDIICHNYLLDKKIATPPYEKIEENKIPGGFVKEPSPGMYDWIVSFDLTSLYPHLIMLCNISPETLISRDIKLPEEENINSFIKTFIDKEYHIDNRYCNAANGAKFKKDERGFLAELMKIQFSKRKTYKDEMLKLEKIKNPTREIQNKITALFNAQWSKKIQLNSLYGSLTNTGCRYYDWRLGSAITMTGQLAVRWIENKINIMMNKLMKTEGIDYVIAIDTDSCYLNCKPLVDALNLTDVKKIVDFLDKIAKEKIQPYIQKSYQELSEYINAYEQALHMKRENIVEKAIWTGKKHYVMSVWDSEGKRYEEPELKVVGIESVRSTTPKVCRDSINETIKLIMSTDNSTVINYIENFRKKFVELPFEDVAFPSGVNGISKYEDKQTIFKKGCPIHVRASLIYNHLLKEKKLDNKYNSVYDKDKIKYCYLKLPNHIQSNVIASPKRLPPEFDVDKYIDKKLQFEKTYLSPIKAILDVIGWKIEEEFNLEEFLK